MDSFINGELKAFNIGKIKNEYLNLFSVNSEIYYFKNLNFP
jgi:hypothetical protein